SLVAPMAQLSVICSPFLGPAPRHNCGAVAPRQKITDAPKDGFASPSGSALRGGGVANNSAPFLPDNRELITDNRAAGAAFTLIEMTVVILIIAILAGLIFTAGSSAIDHARKVQAKNDVTQIVTAVNGFYTEYGRYPVLSTIGANG